MVERIIFKYLFIANLEDKSNITINLHGQKYVHTHLHSFVKLFF